MRGRVNVKNLIILSLVTLFCISFARQEITMRRLNKDIESKHKQLKELSDKNKNLQDEVNESTTDKYIERLARERLGMIKKGEKVIINADSPK